MQYWSSEIEKQVGDRVQIVLRDPYLMYAYREFGDEILRRSSVFHGLDKFMKDQCIEGKLCFEIGTWNGLTAAILSRYFECVVTVDIAHRPMKHDVLRHLGIKNVECFDIVDNEDKARVFRRFDSFDFAYMDGDHSHDTETDFELVKGCGRVLFHECWPHQKAVFDRVHMLPASQVTTNGKGLALWDSTKAAE